MRFMLTFRIPMDKGNAWIRQGQVEQTMQSILGDLKPEAAYFGDMDGARGGYLVINMDDASQIPAMAEPLFLGLDATVEFHPVMTPEDLQKAGSAIQQAVQKYR
jgi:hypothetical protein